MTKSNPTKVSDLPGYQRWLQTTDQPWPKVVTISQVTVEKAALAKIDGEALVLDFVGEDFRLPLSKKLAFAMVKATGTEVFADWIGKVVTLTTDVNLDGAVVIAIEKGGSRES